MRPVRHSRQYSSKCVFQRRDAQSSARVGQMGPLPSIGCEVRITGTTLTHAMNARGVRSMHTARTAGLRVGDGGKLTENSRFQLESRLSIRSSEHHMNSKRCPYAVLHGYCQDQEGCWSGSQPDWWPLLRTSKGVGENNGIGEYSMKGCLVYRSQCKCLRSFLSDSH